MPSRRNFIRYLGSAAALAGHRPLTAVVKPKPHRLGFTALPHGIGPDHRVAPGYRTEILLRWGDAVSGSNGAFDPPSLSAAEQATRFGYNNDFLAFFSLPAGSQASDHGLLCVNHEFTNTNFMWPDLNLLDMRGSMTADRTAVEMAAMGHSVVEIRLSGAHWRVVDGSYNRRITADTPIRLSGPAGGHARLRTRDNPEGDLCRGLLNPCSGGKTPWGTVLSAEENFHMYFQGRARDERELHNHGRYGVGGSRVYSWWSKHNPRFNVELEPREANRFGWVVEIDPYQAESPAIKRTALGRFKHEAATTVVSHDGRVVVYSGDDEAFEYLYRFVTRQAFDPQSPDKNRDLLDEGDLYVARFHDDGRLNWMRLRFGEGPLTPANGFRDQGDVLIETRRAADLLGATQLDRPEDVETNPLDGSIYAMLTGNPGRSADTLDAANPRNHNHFGHVLRLLPPGAPGQEVEHTADEFRWEIFVLAGDPDNHKHHASYPGDTAGGGWFVAPDNCAFDPRGRLWIATDQGSQWRKSGFADGLWACSVEAGGDQAFKRFYQAPIGAEVCGPEFTPDGRTLFLAIQHPGVDGALNSSYSRPATRWPDFDPGLPPRPAVIAIRHEHGGEIGD